MAQLTAPADLQVLAGPADLGLLVAERILDRLREQPRVVLGVPAGRTMRPVFTALTRLLGSTPVSLDKLIVIMMDEYLQAAGGSWRAVDPHLSYSCRRFGIEEVVQPLNAVAERPMPAENLWSPDPGAPHEYDERIAGAGGVDLFLVAVGASDGHVAFNPPGTELDSTTRVVELADTTRTDNVGTFPGFGDLHHVPTHGVSVGLGTIAAAREVVMVVHGAHKHEAFRRLVSADTFAPAWPATFVHTVRAGSILADQAAAGGLS